MQTKTNYLAIVACAVVNMLLGMGWYGSFSEQWMAGNNLTMERINSGHIPPGVAYAISAGVALVTALILNMLFKRMNVSGWMDGLKMGGAIGLFGLLGTIVGNMYAMRPYALSWIDGGYVFLQFALYGVVLGGWQKK